MVSGSGESIRLVLGVSAVSSLDLVVLGSGVAYCVCSGRVQMLVYVWKVAVSLHWHVLLVAQG